jgi:hypothetical protein
MEAGKRSHLIREPPGGGRRPTGMKHNTRIRTAALLAILALAAAACSAASADDTSDTTPPTTGVPAGDAPMPVPGEDDTVEWRPIPVEGDLPSDGSVVGGGQVIAVDGNRVTVGFWMGVEDCYGVQRIDVAETETKVAIDITVSARDVDQVCIALAEARAVTVELDAPLGGRVVEIGGAPVNS